MHVLCSFSVAFVVFKNIPKTGNFSTHLEELRLFTAEFRLRPNGRIQIWYSSVASVVPGRFIFTGTKALPTADPKALD